MSLPFYNCYTHQKIFFGLLSLIVLLTIGNSLQAQTQEFDPNYYYQQSLNIQRSGMHVLGGWALLNIVSGVYGNYKFSQESKYFFQMNAAWNMVNLGIAGIGLYGVANSSLDIQEIEMFSEMSKFDRILLINAGLDLIYIGVGSTILKKGLKKNSSRMIGYGRSIILQGGFLLLFDLGLYMLHSNNTEVLFQLTERLQLTYSGIRVNF